MSEDSSLIDKVLVANVKQIQPINMEDIKDIEDIKKLFFDGEKNIEQRTTFLEEINRRSVNCCREIVDTVCSMYYMFENSINKKLLQSIVKNKSIDIDCRLNCARSIYDKNREEGYKCLHLLTNSIESLPSPIKLELIKTLLESEINKENTIKIATSLFNDERLECEYRYDCIVRITKDIKKYIKKYIEQIYYNFITYQKNHTRYRIMCSQYLLTDKKSEHREKTMEIISSFCLDETLDYNLRADAADTLLKYGDKKHKDIAKDIIFLLGRENSLDKTVYGNRQNVHDEDIESSTLESLRFIFSINTAVNYTFEDVCDYILETINDLEENSKNSVKSSILRISLDQSLYNGYNLRSILLKIYTIISNHKDSLSLKNRLIEELIDMANTCSSGHVSRLVNIFSGFSIDENTNVVNLKIGIKKEIQSVLIAKINYRIKKIEDENVKEKILEELSSSGNISEKKNLSFFFRSHICEIEEEIRNDYISQSLLTEQQFAEYFREAVVFFEES